MGKILFNADNTQLSGLEGRRTWTQTGIPLLNKGAALELVGGQVVELS